MRRRLGMAGVLAAMVVTAVNIPFGATVAGLWVASRLVEEGGISMVAVGAFVVVAGALAIGLAMVLSRLGQLHDRLAGRPATARRQTAWLRPMSAERPGAGGVRQRARALDVVLVLVVVATLLGFELWFLLLSGSPLDSGSGRT